MVLGAGEVRLWDVKEGRPFRLLPIEGRSISSVAFAGDGKILATGTEEGVRYRDFRRGIEKASPKVEAR